MSTKNRNHTKAKGGVDTRQMIFVDKLLKQRQVGTGMGEAAAARAPQR